jgi:hypothetical protein
VSAVPAGLVGTAKGDAGTSQDPWSNFCAVDWRWRRTCLGRRCRWRSCICRTTATICEFVYLFIHIYDSFVLLY